MSKAERIAAKIKQAADDAWEDRITRQEHWDIATALWQEALDAGVEEEVQDMCRPRFGGGQ